MATIVFNPFTGTFDYVGAGGSGSGTVTSVGLSLPAEFTVTISPITGAGTLTAVWATEAAATVFAGPVSGPNAVPAFRALVATDIPPLPYIPGTLPLDHHADLTNFTANDDHTQYLLRAGRAGTANDALLSTTTDGTLTGSSVASLAFRLDSGTPQFPGPIVMNEGWSTTLPVLPDPGTNTLEFFHAGRRDATFVPLGVSQGVIPGSDTITIGVYAQAINLVLGENGGTPHGGANYRFVDIGATGSTATWKASADGPSTFDHFGLQTSRNLVSDTERLTLSFWTAVYDHSTYSGTFDPAPGGVNTTVEERRFIDDEPTVDAGSTMIQRLGYSFGDVHGTGDLISSVALHCTNQRIVNDISTGGFAAVIEADMAAQSAGNRYTFLLFGDAPSAHPGTFRFGDTPAFPPVIAVQPVEIVGNLLLDNLGTAAELRFREPSGSGTNYTAFKAQAQAGTITYTLPAADAAGMLTSNGSGALSWDAASGLAIAGDVTGTLAATTVIRINGNDLGVTLPFGGRVLLGDGSAWQSTAISGDATLVSTGVLTVTAIHGVAYNADPLAQYVKISGRTGTGNDFVLSTTTNGNIAGSTVVNQDLILGANTADGTNQAILSLEGGASGSLKLQGPPSGAIEFRRFGTTALTQWFDSASANFVGLAVPALSASYTLTFPTADAAGALSSNGSGTLSFNTALTGAHSALTGLTTGDAGHTQFLLLAGRSGGQTAIGGTASGEDLTLQSTAHTTRGDIFANDRVVALGAAANSSGVTWLGTKTMSAVDLFETFNSRGTWTLNTGHQQVHRAFLHGDDYLFNDTQAGILAGVLCVESVAKLRTTTNGVIMSGVNCFQNEAGYFADPGAGNTATGIGMTSFADFSAITATTGALTVTDWIGLMVVGSMTATAVGSTSTVTTRKGVWIAQPGTSGSGTCAITTNIAIQIDAMTLGTTKRSMLSLDTAAAMLHSGPVRLGDQTAPTEILEVLGNGVITGHATMESGLTGIANATELGLSMSPTMSLTHANAIFSAIDISGTWTNTTDPSNNSLGLNLHPTITCSGAGTLDIVSSLNGVKHAPVYTTATANSIVLADRGLQHAPQFSKTGSGTWAASAAIGLDDATNVDAGLTLTTRHGFRHNAHGGAGAITTDVGLFVGALTGATSIAVDVGALAGGTLSAAVRSAITAATNRWCLLDTGGANSALKGNLRLGDNTAPTALLDLIGKLTADTNGVVTKYNNVATAGRGIASIVAVIDLTTQAAAQVATALFTPATAGMYRISFAITLTRQGTTSTLGSGVNVNYTTGDGATAVVQNVPMWLIGSTTATTDSGSTANTVGLTLIGAVTIYSSTTAVTFDVGYASTGGTAMQYACRVRVEAI